MVLNKVDGENVFYLHDVIQDENKSLQLGIIRLY